MICRQCGACCIAPSISSSIPGMSNGKPAKTRCINLDKNNRCEIFDSDKRPKVCTEYQPDINFCGTCFDNALQNLANLED